MKRRIGRFTVPGCFVDGLCKGEGLNVFAGGAVVNVRHDWPTDRVEYLMYHPSFDEVRHGERFPEYMAIFRTGESEPTWIKQEATNG
jgi:hypothetical protein